MKKEFAVIYNALLENFHFNDSAQPESHAVNLKVMTEGMNHLFFVAQCAGDADSMRLVAAACSTLHAGYIPNPITHTPLNWSA